MRRVILYFMIFGLFGSALMAKNAPELLHKNGCMKCHNVMGIKSAPSFFMIAKMHSGWFGVSKKGIAKSIKYGSYGKYPMFANASMPSYRKLSDKDIGVMTDWIAAQNSRGMRGCMMNHEMKHKIK